MFIFDIFDGKWMKTGHLNHKKVILRKKNENLAQNWAKIGRNRIFDGRTYLLTCINGQKLSGTWFFLSFTEFLYTIEIIIPFLLVWGHSRDESLGKYAQFGSEIAKFTHLTHGVSTDLSKRPKVIMYFTELRLNSHSN